MLAITFQVGTDQFALDIREVIEVVPRVDLHRVAGGAAWLAGTFIYRGRAVPVVDLHRLLGAGECPAHLSSRIILARWPGAEEGALLGLLAAQVADIREVDRRAELAPALASPAGGLGSAVVMDGELLHLVDLSRVLPEDARHPFALMRAGGAG